MAKQSLENWHENISMSQYGYIVIIILMEKLNSLNKIINSSPERSLVRSALIENRVFDIYALYLVLQTAEFALFIHPVINLWEIYVFINSE